MCSPRILDLVMSLGHSIMRPYRLERVKGTPNGVFEYLDVSTPILPPVLTAGQPKHGRKVTLASKD